MKTKNTNRRSGHPKKTWNEAHTLLRERKAGKKSIREEGRKKRKWRNRKREGRDEGGEERNRK